MTQRYAIVPVRDDGGIETAGGVFYPGKIGKVTRAQIEAAAFAICDLFSIPPNAPLTNNPECTVSALEGQISTVQVVAEAIGLEVED